MHEQDSRNRRDSGGGGQQYLTAAVTTASPAKLKLMLIERAVDVAGHLARTWRSQQSLGPNENSLKLLELINELLSGVASGSTPAERDLCRKVADLYVFLAQHLIKAEQTSRAESIDEMKAILEIEAETWRRVCTPLGVVPTDSNPIAMSLNLKV
jgi:flagellar protein FliS